MNVDEVKVTWVPTGDRDPRGGALYRCKLHPNEPHFAPALEVCARCAEETEKRLKSECRQE